MISEFGDYVVSQEELSKIACGDQSAYKLFKEHACTAQGINYGALSQLANYLAEESSAPLKTCPVQALMDIVNNIDGISLKNPDAFKKKLIAAAQFSAEKYSETIEEILKRDSLAVYMVIMQLSYEKKWDFDGELRKNIYRKLRALSLSDHELVTNEIKAWTALILAYMQQYGIVIVQDEGAAKINFELAEKLNQPFVYLYMQPQKLLALAGELQSYYDTVLIELALGKYNALNIDYAALASHFSWDDLKLALINSSRIKVIRLQNVNLDDADQFKKFNDFIYWLRNYKIKELTLENINLGKYPDVFFVLMEVLGLQENLEILNLRSCKLGNLEINRISKLVKEGLVELKELDVGNYHAESNCNHIDPEELIGFIKTVTGPRKKFSLIHLGLAGLPSLNRDEVFSVLSEAMRGALVESYDLNRSHLSDSQLKQLAEVVGCTRLVGNIKFTASENSILNNDLMKVLESNSWQLNLKTLISKFKSLGKETGIEWIAEIPGHLGMSGLYLSIEGNGREIVKVLLRRLKLLDESFSIQLIQNNRCLITINHSSLATYTRGQIESLFQDLAVTPALSELTLDNFWDEKFAKIAQGDDKAYQEFQDCITRRLDLRAILWEGLACYVLENADFKICHYDTIHNLVARLCSLGFSQKIDRSKFFSKMLDCTGYDINSENDSSNIDTKLLKNDRVEIYPLIARLMVYFRKNNNTEILSSQIETLRKICKKALYIIGSQHLSKPIRSWAYLTLGYMKEIGIVPVSSLSTARDFFQQALNLGNRHVPYYINYAKELVLAYDKTDDFNQATFNHIINLVCDGGVGRLILKEAKIRDESSSVNFDISANCMIESITIDNCQGDIAGLQNFLGQLGEKSTIKKFALNCRILSQSWIDCLAKLVHSGKVKELAIVSHELHATLKDLAQAVKDNNELTKFEFACWEKAEIQSSEELLELADAVLVDKKNLEQVSFVGGAILQKPLVEKIIECLPSSYVKNLKLSKVAACQGAFTKLVDNLRHVTVLDISSNQLTKEELKDFFERLAETQNNLLELCLSNFPNFLFPEVLETFGRYLQSSNCRLETLRLETSASSGIPLKQLELAVAKNRTLKVLDFGSSHIDKRSAQLLLMIIKNNSTLEKIELANWDSIPDRVKYYIEGALSNNKNKNNNKKSGAPLLQSLGLPNGGLDDKYLRYIIKNPKVLARLDNINIGNVIGEKNKKNQFSTDVLVKFLEKLQTEKSELLTTLNLSGLQGLTGEEVVSKICELPQHPALKNLDLSYSDFNDAGLAKLLEALTNSQRLISVDLTGCAVSAENRRLLDDKLKTVFLRDRLKQIFSSKGVNLEVKAVNGEICLTFEKPCAEMELLGQLFIEELGEGNCKISLEPPGSYQIVLQNSDELTVGALEIVCRSYGEIIGLTEQVIQEGASDSFCYLQLKDKFNSVFINKKMNSAWVRFALRLYSSLNLEMGMLNFDPYFLADLAISLADVVDDDEQLAKFFQEIISLKSLKTENSQNEDDELNIYIENIFTQYFCFVILYCSGKKDRLAADDKLAREFIDEINWLYKNRNSIENKDALSWLLLARGYIFAFEGKWVKAKACFNEARELGNLLAQFYTALAHFSRHQDEGFLDYLEKLSETGNLPATLYLDRQVSDRKNLTIKKTDVMLDELKRKALPYLMQAVTDGFEYPEYYQKFKEILGSRLLVDNNTELLNWVIDEVTKVKDFSKADPYFLFDIIVLIINNHRLITSKVNELLGLIVPDRDLQENTVDMVSLASSNLFSRYFATFYLIYNSNYLDDSVLDDLTKKMRTIISTQKKFTGVAFAWFHIVKAYLVIGYKDIADADQIHSALKSIEAVKSCEKTVSDFLRRYYALSRAKTREDRRLALNKIRGSNELLAYHFLYKTYSTHFFSNNVVEVTGFNGRFDDACEFIKHKSSEPITLNLTDDDNGSLDLDYAGLFSVAEPSNVYQLNIKTKWNEDKLQALYNFIKKKKVSSLSMKGQASSQVFNPELARKFIQTLLLSDSLKMLVIEGTFASKDMLVKLAGEIGGSGIQELMLHEMDTAAGFLPTLAKNLKELQNLSIASCEISSEDYAKFFNNLAENSSNKLVSLTLSNSAVLSQAMIALASFLGGNNCNLEKLSFANSQFSIEELLQIKSALIDNCSLQVLDFSHTALRDEAVDVLIDILRNNLEIKEIRLDGCNIEQAKLSQLKDQIASNILPRFEKIKSTVLESISTHFSVELQPSSQLSLNAISFVIGDKVKVALHLALFAALEKGLQNKGVEVEFDKKTSVLNFKNIDRIKLDKFKEVFSGFAADLDSKFGGRKKPESKPKPKPKPKPVEGNEKQQVPVSTSLPLFCYMQDGSEVEVIKNKNKNKKTDGRPSQKDVFGKGKNSEKKMLRRQKKVLKEERERQQAEAEQKRLEQERLRAEEQRARKEAAERERLQAEERARKEAEAAEQRRLQAEERVCAKTFQVEKPSLESSASLRGDNNGKPSNVSSLLLGSSIWAKKIRSNEPASLSKEEVLTNAGAASNPSVPPSKKQDEQPSEQPYYFDEGGMLIVGKKPKEIILNVNGLEVKVEEGKVKNIPPQFVIK